MPSPVAPVTINQLLLNEEFDSISSTLWHIEPSSIQPPAPVSNYTTLFFHDEFTNISLYNPDVNAPQGGPNGTWRMNDHWQNPQAPGYIDLGSIRHFDINQTTTDAASYAMMQPYFPLSQLDSTTMRFTATRCRNNAGTTWLLANNGLQQLISQIGNSQSGGLGDACRWLGAQITTDRFSGDTASHFTRPAFVEWRCRWNPSVHGYWTSCWMYAIDNAPANKGAVEFDVLEGNDADPTFFKTNLHEGNGTDINTQVNQPWADNNWHTLGFHWTDTFLRTYWDGNMVVNVTDFAFVSFFDAPMRLFLSLGADSNYFEAFNASPPDNVNILTMDIDYVRVWKP